MTIPPAVHTEGVIRAISGLESGLELYRAGVTQRQLVVDLRGQHIESLNDFWDAVAGPCALPEWFGRNLDAWWDTIENRGISDLIDRYDTLVVLVDRRGLFSPTNIDGARLAEVFAESSQASLDITG